MCAIGLDVANHSLGNTTAIATKLSILLKVLNTLVLAAANRFLGLMHLTGTVRVFFVHFYSVGLILTMMNVSYDSVRSEGGAACKRAVAAAQRNNENGNGSARRIVHPTVAMAMSGSPLMSMNPVPDEQASPPPPPPNVVMVNHEFPPQETPPAPVA